MLEFFKKNKLFLLSIVLIVILISIDQITKNMALSAIDKLMYKTNNIHTHFEIFPFLNIVLVFNKGISFGLFGGNNTNINTIMPTLLILTILLIIVYVFHLLCKNKNSYKSIYLSMILGGAIGNIADRFVHGAVVDFVDFHINNWHFPAFNFADIIISLSVLLIIIEEFLLKKEIK